MIRAQTLYDNYQQTPKDVNLQKHFGTLRIVDVEISKKKCMVEVELPRCFNFIDGLFLLNVMEKDLKIKEAYLKVGGMLNLPLKAIWATTKTTEQFVKPEIDLKETENMILTPLPIGWIHYNNVFLHLELDDTNENKNNNDKDDNNNDKKYYFISLMIHGLQGIPDRGIKVRLDENYCVQDGELRYMI